LKNGKKINSFVILIIFSCVFRTVCIPEQVQPVFPGDGFPSSPSVVFYTLHSTPVHAASLSTHASAGKKTALYVRKLYPPGNTISEEQ